MSLPWGVSWGAPRWTPRGTHPKGHPGGGLGDCLGVCFGDTFGGHIKMIWGGGLRPPPQNHRWGKPSVGPTDDFGGPNHLDMTSKRVAKTDSPNSPPRGVPWGVPWVSPGLSPWVSPGGTLGGGPQRGGQEVPGGDSRGCPGGTRGGVPRRLVKTPVRPKPLTDWTPLTPDALTAWPQRSPTAVSIASVPGAQALSCQCPGSKPDRRLCLGSGQESGPNKSSKSSAREPPEIKF